jgi:hypothetical protein
MPNGEMETRDYIDAVGVEKVQQALNYWREGGNSNAHKMVDVAEIAKLHRKAQTAISRLMYFHPTNVI